LQKRLQEGGAFPSAASGAAGADAGAGTPGQAPAQPGYFQRMIDWVCGVFGIGRPRGTVLTATQLVARNVARAVAVGVATQVASELTKSTGSKTAGTISKAVVRGALGGVMRR